MATALGWRIGGAASPHIAENWRKLSGATVGAVLSTILGAVLLVAGFRSSVADWCDVYSASMKPTILEGDRIFVNKLAYDLKVPFVNWRLARRAEPANGELIVFRSPADGSRLVKRVIAGPGDRIQLANNQLIVNGLPASYGPGDPRAFIALDSENRRWSSVKNEKLFGREHPIMLVGMDPIYGTLGPMTIPEGTYFVLGDNRNESIDSRVFGPVPRELILGEAVRIAASVSPAQHFLPRWSRWFRSLV